MNEYQERPCDGMDMEERLRHVLQTPCYPNWEVKSRVQFSNREQPIGASGSGKPFGKSIPVIASQGKDEVLTTRTTGLGSQGHSLAQRRLN